MPEDVSMTFYFHIKVDNDLFLYYLMHYMHVFFIYILLHNFLKNLQRTSTFTTFVSDDILTCFQRHDVVYLFTTLATLF